MHERRQNDLTNHHWSEPLAAPLSGFDFMRQFSIFATPALASGRSIPSRYVYDTLIHIPHNHARCVSCARERAQRVPRGFCRRREKVSPRLSVAHQVRRLDQQSGG